MPVLHGEIDNKMETSTYWWDKSPLGSKEGSWEVID